MAIDSIPVRIRTFEAAANGEDALDLLDKILESREMGLYVRVPDGFQCAYKRGFIEQRQAAKERAIPERNVVKPTYLELDRHQINQLGIKGFINLEVFNGGALFPRERLDGKVPRDFDYYKLRFGTLEPQSAAIRAATPSAPAVGDCMMIKAPIPGSTDFSYSLQRVGPANTFVGEPNSEQDDPYDLKASSPLLFAILAQAYKYRAGTGLEFSKELVITELKPLSDSWPTRSKPFNGKRREISALLADKAYRYTKKSARRVDSEPLDDSALSDPYFKQEYIHPRLAWALYAACLWNGSMQPRVGSGSELLAKLEELRFANRPDDPEDEARSMYFFITGKPFEEEAAETYVRNAPKQAKKKGQ